MTSQRSPLGLEKFFQKVKLPSSKISTESLPVRQAARIDRHVALHVDKTGTAHSEICRFLEKS
jgi:hypothetical protein